jgi:hypothetical protein
VVSPAKFDIIEGPADFVPLGLRIWYQFQRRGASFSQGDYALMREGHEYQSQPQKRLIWPSRLSPVKILFLLNRYLPFVTVMMGLNCKKSFCPSQYDCSNSRRVDVVLSTDGSVRNAILLTSLSLLIFLSHRVVREDSMQQEVRLLPIIDAFSPRIGHFAVFSATQYIISEGLFRLRSSLPRR